MAALDAAQRRPIALRAQAVRVGNLPAAARYGQDFRTAKLEEQIRRLVVDSRPGELPLTAEQRQHLADLVLTIGTAQAVVG